MIPPNIELPVSPQEKQRRLDEMAMCELSRDYFINTYCQIYDSVARSWIPFGLWDGQRRLLSQYNNNQLLIWLKARQMGISWLALGIIAHSLIFESISSWLVFSKREEEAIYLLGEERLRGMLRRLPDWMLPIDDMEIDQKKQLTLPNGSTVRAFPSQGGDSYTATGALIDEADLVPNLNNLHNRVEPTINAGGKLLLVSRSDKETPDSYFKKLYRAARDGENDFAASFLGWWEHPNRDQAWYDRQVRITLSTTGSLDDVHEQYPATDNEALQERTIKQRIPAHWFEGVYDADFSPLDVALFEHLVDIPSLVIYEMPDPTKTYVIGVDTSEGVEDGDEQAATVMCVENGHEVAHLSGIIELTIFSDHIVDLATFYNYATVMVERNNMGYAVISHLEADGSVNIAYGFDEKYGWLSNTRGKVMLYKACAVMIRDNMCKIRTPKTRTQLGSIQRGTLRAPSTLHDDCADSYALCCVAVSYTDEIWSMAV